MSAQPVRTNSSSIPALTCLTVLGIVLLAIQAGPALAQSAPPPDPLGRDTPRGAAKGYLTAIDQGNYATAAEYLDLRNRPDSLDPYTDEQLARGLSLVLQRSLWIDTDTLSDDPGGRLDDGLPDFRESLGVIPVNGREVNVLLQKVATADSQVWLVSGATIRRLPELYEAYRYHPYIEWLARHVPTASFLGVELFKWLAALTLTVVAAPLVLLATAGLARALTEPQGPLRSQVRWLLTRPVAALVLFWIFHSTMLEIGFGAQGQRLANTQTVLILLSLWVVWSLADVLREAYLQRLVRMGRPASLPLLQPLTTALKWIFVLLGVLMWLDNLDYEITALLTGLGVGGLAVALVLQRPLEDVLGAVSLYTQQPIKIGDFGRFGGYSGTIEGISLRTTRIRTLENTLVSVPNARMASEPIENLSARKRMLYQPVLHLRHDTDPSRLQQVLSATRELLNSNPHVIRDGARVRFTDIGASGFELRLFAYIDVADSPAISKSPSSSTWRCSNCCAKRTLPCGYRSLRARRKDETVKFGSTPPERGFQIEIERATSWLEPIVAMWRFTRNNGITEGFHTKMEMMTRRAYGFRNFENYRLRVLTHCGWDGIINRV